MKKHLWKGIALMAALLLWGLGAAYAAPAGQRFVVAKQVLKKQSSGQRWAFGYEYPSIRQRGALMGMAENLRDFNARMAARAQQAFKNFKHEMVQYPAKKGMPGQSELTARYEVVSNTGGYLGVRFLITTYWIGGAHPYGQARTVNWLSDGTFVTLEKMFEPGNRALAVLSQVCKQRVGQQVSKQGYEVFAEALAPQAKNFKSFVATRNGLAFSFDQATVAPSVVGMVTVTVPWADVSSLLSPTGKRVQQQFNR